MLRVAIIGAGGYALEHHEAIRKLEVTGEFVLVATCDPDPTRLAAAAERFAFAERNVQTFGDYRSMLDAAGDQLDLVTVPTPPNLHAEMHAACVERDIACYLEKPPTLDPDELEDMVALDARATTPTNVGFNFIIEPERRLLKQRILSREFGRIQEVSYFGLWPRNDTYYTRAPWAGKVSLDGRLVLDTIVGNAMAHYTHNVLFWAGSEMDAWANPVAVRAELYRARDIEGPDAMFIEAELESGALLRIGATHACSGEHRHGERVILDHAEIEYFVGSHATVRYHDGRTEDIKLRGGNLLSQNLSAYARVIRGETSRTVTSLADSKPFVRLHALAFAASPIASIAEASIDRRNGCVAIDGVDAAIMRFVDEGYFPTDQKVAWAAAGGAATDIGDLRARLISSS